MKNFRKAKIAPNCVAQNTNAQSISLVSVLAKFLILAYCNIFFNLVFLAKFSLQLIILFSLLFFFTFMSEISYTCCNLMFFLIHYLSTSTCIYSTSCCASASPNFVWSYKAFLVCVWIGCLVSFLCTPLLRRNIASLWLVRMGWLSISFLLFLCFLVRFLYGVQLPFKLRGFVSGLLSFWL